jgi:histidine kinase-like protein
MMVTAGSYHQVFQGQPEQVCQVRHAVGQHVRDTPVADDVVLIASELAANAVLHSKSAGEVFAVSCQVSPQCVRVEVADLGGEWCTPELDGRPHGLDLITALATKWDIKPGTGGCRVVWARIDFPGRGMKNEDLLTRRESRSAASRMRRLR